ncbi:MULTISPECIES: glycosyltransferase family 2 protein [unclassified Clostridium]|uniref:glycosyltransferase family 2 protein n=1 Tax=unclassified Clostridium TaxID=2614128 RepID=UPI0013F9246C|nr:MULTISPECIES: glycosyltransferase family 2 protein [unclassified Clostridium]NFR85891.1 glycosyltransferase family 2 protein [Clostridium botulinum]NFR90361.1 glycosyltransferase family 2 protein [Clostridium botulinum]NFT98253.1 glycosyltransferase family 2 protein [Clostridium botulinum]
MEKISIVVPCYYEEKSLPLFYEKINEVSKKMNKVEFEIILVNDGSKDNTLKLMKNYANLDTRVKYISLSRNFGKESALYAGLENSTGDYIAVMDADLQDPPELLEQMYENLINEDYDCIATRRVDRKGEPPIRSFFARCFYKLINKISNTDIVDGARDFRLMKRKMVEAILQMKEYNRFSKGIFGWVGFNTKWIAYENIERVAGETKWSFWKLFKYSIEGIVAFSTAPLLISSFIGILFFIISFIMICFIIVRTLIVGDPVAGWPSLVCIIFFVGGIQLFCTGILGQYLAKAYIETKNRPIYIIKESNMFKSKDRINSDEEDKIIFK